MKNNNATQNSTPDLQIVDTVVAECGRSADAVIPILQKLQDHFRYLPEAALRRVCELTEITPASIAGVSTFYSQFRHKPVGRHIISICHGTACHVKGAGLIHDALTRHLHIKTGEDTDPTGAFTLERVACLGCCTLAPVIKIDGVTYGHLTPETVSRAVQDFLELEKRHIVPQRYDQATTATEGLTEIRIGVGSCCVAGGSQGVRQELEDEVRKLGAAAVIKPVGCVGMCHQTPLVQIVSPDGKPVTYAKVRAEDAAQLVRKHFKPRGLVRRVRTGLTTAMEHLLTDDTWTPVTRYALDVRDAPVCAFLGKQERIASEWCGDIDPLDLDEYCVHGGMTALTACIKAGHPDEIVQAVTQSGLRGRGGAGFPTGRKWAMVRKASGPKKHIICNGDEGDPGAFMDRMLLESFPYRVLEGMIIAAYAVGASEGVLYIRAEYPLAIRRITEALSRMEKRGYLGKSIAGSDFTLSLRVVEGAGAFVSGEETALLASIEGQRAMPRFRPPYPAECGLWGCPTAINNVETLAMVPWIIRNGAARFAAMGTATSAGTKVFSLTGKVNRGGLIEVPMGITIREIVEEIGGGTETGKPFKAVQIGGPSGGCLPASCGETRVDYEALATAGCIMGSGGLVVLDEADCMVDLARYFMTFTQQESCGKCTPCRVGTKRMLEILERLCAGKGQKGDIEHLEHLAQTTRTGSLCGLGRTAPNPVLSTIRHFRQEYDAHLAGRCPSRKCQALIAYRINEKCIGCTKCSQACPADAIEFAPYQQHVIQQDKCTRCDTCRQVCPVDAVWIGDPCHD
ncbi:MAG: NAD(P)H-dependent oxidoreductase subunit E [bacterium]